MVEATMAFSSSAGLGNFRGHLMIERVRLLCLPQSGKPDRKQVPSQRPPITLVTDPTSKRHDSANSLKLHTQSKKPPDQAQVPFLKMQFEYN